VKKDSAVAKLFQSLFIGSSNITAEQIKQSVLNSGILFETKLKQNKKFQISEDLKGNLLKILHTFEKEGDKDNAEKVKELIKEIEIYQLLSKTTNSIFTFLPLLWSDLKDSNIAFKKGKKENQFFCKIFLDFQEKGKLITLIMMFNKEFYISFKIEDKELEKKIKDKIEELVLNLWRI